MIDDKDLEKLAEIKRKREGKFSKRIVSLVIILNVVFAATVLYVFLRTSSEPTVLVGCWFAFTTGELWMLSSIKKKKSEEENYNG